MLHALPLSPFKFCVFFQMFSSLFFPSPCAALLRKISGYLQPGSRIAHELAELLREPEAISVRYRDYDWSRNDA